MRCTTTAAVVAALAGSTMAVKEERTFAVLGFNGNDPLTEGCVDPIVSPGKRAAHAHTIMGASNFGTTVTAEGLSQSECTNAKVPGDNSVYWMPKLYFQDPSTGKLEDVKLYYAKIYYFMDPTDDDIEPFPPGLQMISGDASARSVPPSGGNLVLDPEDGEIQPAQWTCPQADITKNAFPADSDGSRFGIKNSAPSAHDFGSGFPTEKCDRQFSPLRADLHFPSCYNPDVGLEDWKNNMVWPSRKYQKNGSGRANCPPGHVHVPHLFFEFYWNTIEFMDRWTVDGVNQPFLLSNGDRTGFSLHGDFVSAWDTKILADIIDNCNAGTLGMDKCVQGLDLSSSPKCQIESPVSDVLTGVMDELPCGNSIAGWGVGDDVGSVASFATEYEPSDLPAADVDPEPSAVPVQAAAVPDPEVKVEATPEEQYYSAPEEPAEMQYESTPEEPAEEHAKAAATEAAAVPEVPSSEPEVDVNAHVVTEWVTQTVVVSTTVVVGGPEETGAEYKNKVKRSHGHQGHMQKHKRRHDF